MLMRIRPESFAHVLWTKSSVDRPNELLGQWAAFMEPLLQVIYCNVGQEKSGELSGEAVRKDHVARYPELRQSPWHNVSSVWSSLMDALAWHRDHLNWTNHPRTTM